MQLMTIDPDKMVTFMETVLARLDYMGYPNYVEFFTSEDVAHAIGQTIVTCFVSEMSPNMTACIVFGCTWEYQILPSLKEITKH